MPVAACLIVLLTAGRVHGAGWYDAAWSSRMEITVDNTKVMATHTDFPLLVLLTADDDLKAGARSDGFDILFTDDDGTTKLDHEIEEWDDTNGDLVAWVRIPSLPDTVDKVIYLYYGNSGAADQQNATGVWVNYVGVWHLNETSGTRVDSTSSNNDLTEQNSVVSVPGKMAGCIDLEEANSERLYITDAAQTGLDITGNLTMQAWVKPESVPGSITFLDKYAGSAFTAARGTSTPSTTGPRTRSAPTSPPTPVCGASSWGSTTAATSSSIPTTSTWCQRRIRVASAPTPKSSKSVPAPTISSSTVSSTRSASPPSPAPPSGSRRSGT
jgi:hypothetical protein